MRSSGKKDSSRKRYPKRNFQKEKGSKKRQIWRRCFFRPSSFRRRSWIRAAPRELQRFLLRWVFQVRRRKRAASSRIVFPFRLNGWQSPGRDPSVPDEESGRGRRRAGPSPDPSSKGEICQSGEAQPFVPGYVSFDHKSSIVPGDHHSFSGPCRLVKLRIQSRGNGKTTVDVLSLAIWLSVCR